MEEVGMEVEAAVVFEATAVVLPLLVPLFQIEVFTKEPELEIEFEPLCCSEDWAIGNAEEE